MRHFKLYLNLLLLLAVGFVSCQDDFDRPPMVVPEAAHVNQVNTTILELKTAYWSDDRNYIDTIGLTAAGDSMVIKGRVISSDESGNIYKNLVIQDSTAAITISINGTSLYNTYRIGQEIVLPVSDLFIGKYNGLQQLGYPEYSASYGWEATFLPLAIFQSRVELNGLPEAAKIDTMTVKLSELSTTPEGLCKMQSQLVRLNDVFFTEADGTTTFSESDASTSRTLQDEEGNTIIVRNSNYADFQSDILPLGTGSIVGILSYYGTAWQLVLRSTDDCIGFTTDTKGTVSNPYDVAKAIELQGTGKDAWVSGYIVGAVAPEVTSVSSNSDIEWTAPTTLANTLVIGQTADTKDIANCLIITLASGTDLRTAANLVDNPKAYQTEIKLKGTFENVMGTYGITNSGSSDEYVMSYVGDGVTSLTEDFSGGDIPTGWNNVQLQGTKDWYVTSYNSNYYAAMTGYQGTAPFDSWLVTPALNVDGAAEKVFSFKTQVNGYSSTTTTMKVYVLSSADPSTATKTELTANWATAPSSGYSSWAESGDIDLSAFSGTIYIGFQYAATTDSNYATWCVDDFLFGSKSGSSSGGETSLVTSINEGFEDGSLPSSWTNVQISGDKDWYVTSYNSNYYAAMTGYKGTAPFDSWLITPGIDIANVSSKTLSFKSQVNGYSSTTTTMKVYVLTSADPSTATKTELTANWATAPSSGYSDWAESGSIDLSAFSGTIYIGFQYAATTDSNYATWCVDDVVVGDGSSSGGGDDDQPTVTSATQDDFETLNGGSAIGTYGTYTTTNGWTATNCNVLTGGAADNNPTFVFIGYKTGSSSQYAFAACMNGKTTTPGTISSPTISGGCGTLSFSYGQPYTESNGLSFRVDIIQNGSVVKTETVTTATTKTTAYSHTMNVNVTGEFSILFTNLMPSASTSNKDRTAIWNVNWTNNN